MAATRRPARPPTRRTSSSGRPSTRTAPPPQPSLLTRAGRSLAAATEGHRADLAGLVAVALAVLCGLGVYMDAAGPFGRVAAAGAGALVGAARVLVPPVLLIAGIALIRGRREPAEDEDVDELDEEEVGVAPTARLALGAALVVAGALGLLHLGRGSPSFGGGVDHLSDAAGYAGASVGEPVQSLLGGIGAVIVLVLAAVCGVLLVTRTSLRTVAETTAAGAVPAARSVGRAVAALFRVGEEPVIDLRDGATDDDPPVMVGNVAQSSLLYDQDADAPEPKPKRSRKRKTDAEKAAADALVEPADDTPPEQLEIALGPAGQRSAWKLPPASLLTRSGAQTVDTASVQETGRNLERALATHGVETRLVGMTVGPTVTRYELELGPGVKVARVTSLHKDIAYAMATPDVRILAPIPGKQAIGVEIPNTKKQLVTVGDILASEEARKATHPLEVAVGRDIAGNPVLANLATMPHVLIAGATGAGKSSCINSLLTSILMRSTPEQMRMILIDPKRVELGQYNRLPHLLTEVVTNPKKAANALAWAVREMERRYDLLAETHFRDITGYNAAFDRGELPTEEAPDPEGRSYVRLPFILVVVDELNDLMMVAARDVEESICRIAQMARAVGIHLVIATQRPSVNVITGVIKANIPARWAFAVSSLADSRVILDQPGAERLLGRGDMLLLGPASSIPQRIQGSWVTEEEARGVVGHWIRQAPEVAYDEQVQGSEDGPSGSGGGGLGGSGDDDDDDLLDKARELVVRSQLGSTSMLQRKLRVGFARAGRIMDLLEQQGVVGPSTGSKARAVLMTVEELDPSDGLDEPDDDQI